jgi:hypothetical protein
MTKQQPDYLAYLLRLWQVNGGNGPADSCDQKPVWRASLEDPSTRERIGFAGLEALFDFLQAQITGTLPRDSIQTIRVVPK